jgi:hypothetical protein
MRRAVRQRAALGAMQHGHHAEDEPREQECESNSRHVMYRSGKRSTEEV